MAASMKLLAQTARMNFSHFRYFLGAARASKMKILQKLHTNVRKPNVCSYSCHVSGVASCSMRRIRMLCTISQNDRACWNCGSKTDVRTELYFCSCGVVQSVPSDLTYFDAMGFEQAFDLDTSRLSELYKDLQRKLHPDKFTLKSKEERDIAERQSAFINRAYWTLLKPLSRGLYLLELLGDPVEESNTSVDPDFLMEMMEVNEDVAEASSDKQALDTLEAINRARIDNTVSEVSQAFAGGDVALAKQGLIKLKYFTNIDDKIKGIFRSHMDH